LKSTRPRPAATASSGTPRNCARPWSGGGATVTKDCGYHVHVDARDLTYWDMRRLIRLYARIENALFQVVSASRQTSQYCKRCGDQYLRGLDRQNPRDRHAVTKAVYNVPAVGRYTVSELKDSKYHHKRYAALNLHSWYYRGTIECRLHQGTVNAERVVNWGMLWAALIDWVATHTDKALDTLPGDSFECLLSLAPVAIRDWLAARRAHFQHHNYQET
jgi:hypothetical protein